MGKRIITIGEVMMRLAACDHQRFLQTDRYDVHFGGAEANVAISLAQLGQETVHITAFPNHDLGKAACNYLSRYGVDTSHITYLNQGRLGLYFHETGSMQRSSRIIYDRFGSSFSLLQEHQLSWDAIFEDAHWLHWTGITPALSETAAHLCLTAIIKAKEKGITVSGDINYRRNLWQYGKQPLDIMPELIDKTDVIIAGLTDFENCMAIKEDNFEAACREAQTKFQGITTIATTKRDSISASEQKLSALLYHNTKVYPSKSYEMTGIIDRIGGGDAFMAGLIYGLLYKDHQEALEFALAASVLKHAVIGDANLVTVEEIEALVIGKNTGRLLR
ncbi:sugar kinase [Aquimarina sp. U1-2]|uniref:sugar kinase n=1 Tax=Aquimarina sp. U1-2 TaxID=2823141 RepID=UPI001AEC8FF1|nr:sugar kinase [Aquimarina sp. U1-2]MBP2831465.1 sugar kinase [Aquimarina sp. U1-2]